MYIYLYASVARTVSVPGPQLSWGWGCLGATRQHWGSHRSWGRIHSWCPCWQGGQQPIPPRAMALTPQLLHLWLSSPRGIHRENTTGAPHRPLAPHLLKVRHGERLLAPCYEFPEGVDDGSMSRQARGVRWQLLPTRARSGVTPTPAAASPAASCTAVLEQLPVGRC